MILAELGNPDDGEEEDTRIDYSMGKTGDNQMPKPPKSINLDIDDEERILELIIVWVKLEPTDAKTTKNLINLDIDEAKKKDRRSRRC